MLDESGALFDQIAYNAFNVVMAQANPHFDNPILFASREFDTESGLYYHRARYYDPVIGRWTSEDPLGFAAGDANLYRYVGNMATLATDSSGRRAFVLIIIVATIIGAVSGGVTGYVTGEGSSTAGSFIPGWGAGRSAGAHFRRGNYWHGAGYTALAASDVFLVRAVATKFDRVGFRLSAPGTMSVYRETGRYRLSGEPTTHDFWSVSGRQSYPYYHAINTVHNGRAGVFVVGSEITGIAGYNYSQVFWSPVLNIGMAGMGRHGYPGTNCFQAWATAWSAGNYHWVPYFGLH
ncbi:MAG: RHS repeat-associated core domain-containing protein [Gemmatales bacterium]|nr:RHS repeat-associated core domain-containing protein [Gemmatales bacterium]MDW7994941.1 RHS repeat-associated core domain-containing protein [Gemmatales bacterium]